MRDLDSRGYITGDFLLVAGDVVANIQLESALVRHRARRAKDKSAVMTMLLREAGPEHRSKPERNRPVFVLAPQTNRCIWYDEMWKTKDRGRYLELDPEFLGEHSEIEVRSDLIDCAIDICTPEVLSLWSENFDFNSIRRGFLRGVLKDYELNGKTFHTHILTSGYAARVRDLRAYDAISRDIITRWTYPLTPDCNLFAGQSYHLGKHQTYLEDGVSLARGSKITRRSMVGQRTSVGIGSTVTDSVLGRGCHIGNHATIRGAYLWADCSVGDGSTIDGAVVADGAAVGRNCTIGVGCLVAANVRIADGVNLPPGTRLTRTGPIPKDAASASAAGAAGDGHTYHSPSSSAGSSPAASPLLGALSRSSSAASLSSLSTLHSQSSPSSRRASSAGERPDAIPGTSPASAIYLPDDDAPPTTKLQRDFVGEATASIHDGLVAHEPADKIRLELVAQRLAADAADRAVRDALVAAFLHRTWTLIDADGMTPATAVKQIWAVEAYGWLLAQMGMFDTGATAAASATGAQDRFVKPDQVAVLRAIEASCAAPGRAKGKEVLLFATREGIEGRWLQIEGIREWWALEGTPAVRGLVKTYVEFLEDEEASSSEEEESSDEEESE